MLENRVTQRLKFVSKGWMLALLALSFFLLGCSKFIIKESYVGLGWSNNSVNTVIFRNSAVTTFKNYQFVAYYNPEGKMVLAKRKLNSDSWEVKISKYSGNVKDAHNDISIAVDSEGFLHISWDQHNTILRYVRSKQPLSLELTEELSMTGIQEDKVTYPEFHNLPNGGLLFFFRSGESGRGNLVINQYDVSTKSWKQIQNNLLDGEEQRSAYWQTAIGNNGAIYLSWVWRETWDVSTNHDICFAVSYDGGVSWQNSKEEKYTLPITVNNAEVIWEVPQNSSLINQTSMTIDENGNPYIATYWNKNGVPQYKVVFLKGNKWQLKDTDFHKSPFDLGGGGTKSIPMSRPELLVDNQTLYLLYRDEEQENKIMLAYTPVDKTEWRQHPITLYGVGQWEPNYDIELWKRKKKLHIFSQRVIQADGEGLTQVPPQSIHIIALTNFPKKQKKAHERKIDYHINHSGSSFL